MWLHYLAASLYVDTPKPHSARTCYIIGQQYSDKFPEIVMVELLNESYLPSFQYRFEVIREIEAGFDYYTAHVSGEKIIPLHKLALVTVNGEKFLRIDSPAEARDELGKIPEI